MGEHISHASEATFDETVASADGPVLVDFWAEWCGPCKMIAPILDEVASENEGKVTVVKVNVDDQPGLARRYEVMSIPTLILFKDGDPAKRLVGARGKSQLMADLADYL